MLLCDNEKHHHFPFENLQYKQVVDKNTSYDELMIVTITHSYEARKRSYQLLAEMM